MLAPPQSGLPRICGRCRSVNAPSVQSAGIGGVAKPWATSDGQVFDLLPVHKPRVRKARGRRQRWQRRAAQRKPGRVDHRVAEAVKAQALADNPGMREDQEFLINGGTMISVDEQRAMVALRKTLQDLRGPGAK